MYRFFQLLGSVMLVILMIPITVGLFQGNFDTFIVPFVAFVVVSVLMAGYHVVHTYEQQLFDDGEWK